MLISKFNVYKDEWLDLVFDDRNKSYGAYELRQHYPQVMVKAMVIALTSVLAATIVFGVIIKPVVVKAPTQGIIQVSIPYIPPQKVQPPKLAAHPKLPKVLPASAKPVTTTQYVPLVVKPDPLVVNNPPKAADLQNANIGPETIKGTSGTPSVDQGPVSNTPGGGGDIDNSVHPADGLERMPEPYGGSAAWSKFLQKHLNYPQQAIEENMQGHVFVSFIIEKDGHLSNITVTRGAGFGMDEEALRVLKLAPAWKPGIQNGQPVRVQYTMPINFLLGDNN